MQIYENYSLKHLNTFGIEAKAKFLVSVSDEATAKEIIKLPEFVQNKHLLLGGGSNVLLMDNFAGMVLHNEIKGISVVAETNKMVRIKAMSGEIWHELVLFCIENEYYGIENMALIPGTVGAAPMQNIGAYGVELKDVFYDLEALNLATGKVEIFTYQQCDFRYRKSIFKNELSGKYFILSVTIELQKEETINTSYGAIENELLEKGIKTPKIKDVFQAVVSIRKRKLPDPKEIGNSGSFFKNPVVNISDFERLKKNFPTIPSYPAGSKVKLAAGWLIEQCGFKGIRIKNYGVHKNQALVLVNYGGATGEEIYNLSTKIMEYVKKRFAVTLEREVNVVY